MSADNYFITDQNAVYFLTFTVIDWIDVCTRKEYKIVIADSLNYCIENKGLEVYVWRLISNHFPPPARLCKPCFEKAKK